MHPRSAVALRIEDATPIENVLVCRRCPVLASPRTSLDTSVEVVTCPFFVPRTETPGRHCPKCRPTGVEFFFGVDPDYMRHRVARSRCFSMWLCTTVPAVVNLSFDLGSTR